MKEQTKSKLAIITSMCIFGTIGLFRNNIIYSSGLIAFARGLIGVLFLIAVMIIGRKGFSFKAIKKCLPLLCFSGACVGINWIFLFEAYRYTSISTATLCYYMSPVLATVWAAILCKERLTPKKIICTLFALVGMVIVSGIFSEGGSSLTDMTGIAFGLGAALLYSFCVITNKFIHEISDYERTAVQLSVAAFVIIPYVLFLEPKSALVFDMTSIVLLIIMGVIHTGLAYTLYFGSLEKLETHTASIMSYIDPIVAIILSALVMSEEFTVLDLCGTLLVLGSTFISEFSFKNIKFFKKTIDK